MPELKTYRLFISHAWRYGGEYDKMVNLLDNAPNFNYWNYSCPREDPAIDPEQSFTDTELIAKLKNQIRPVNCVVVLAGMYAAYSKWIQKEIDIALELYKPIVGVYPWGNERLPEVVANAADEVVRWNTSSIVGAIRNNAL